LPAPVLADEEKPMLDLVPLAGPGGKWLTEMAADLVGQLL